MISTLVGPAHADETPPSGTLSSAMVSELDREMRNAAPTVPGGEENLEAWSRLTPAKKEEMAQLLATPQFAELVASGTTDQSTVEAVSDELEIVSEEGVTNSKPEGGPLTWGTTKRFSVNSYWVNTFKFAGVTITKIKQSFDYQTNGSSVTKVYSCKHSSTNYAPTRSLSGDTSFWKSGTKGRCSTVWELHYAIAWIPTPLYRSFTQNMQVNGSKGIEKKWFD